MPNLAHLSKNIRKKLIPKINQQQNLRTIEIARSILQELVYNTPVDTSKLLSNWQIGIGSPYNVDLPAYSVGSLGSTYLSSAADTLAIGNYRLSQRQIGEPIYISNNAPYVREVDQGTSTRVGYHFIEPAVIRGKDNALRNLSKP